MGNKGRKMSNTLHSSVKWITHFEPTAIVAKYLNLNNLAWYKTKYFTNIDTVRICTFYNFYNILRLLTVFYNQWVQVSGVQSSHRRPPSLRLRTKASTPQDGGQAGLRVPGFAFRVASRELTAGRDRWLVTRNRLPGARSQKLTWTLSPSNTFVLEKLNASYEFRNARLHLFLWKEWRKIRRMPYCAMPLFRISFRHA